MYRQTVVIVEDDRETGCDLRTAFERAGYRGRWFPSGMSAITYLHQGAPCDVLIADQNLGDVNGTAVMEEAHWDHPERLIYVWSEFSHLVVRAAKYGFVQTLPKGVPDEDIVTIVQLALARQAKQASAVSGDADDGDLVIFSCDGLQVTDRGRIYLGGLDTGLTGQAAKFLVCLARANGASLTYRQIATCLYKSAKGQYADAVRKVKSRTCMALRELGCAIDDMLESDAVHGNPGYVLHC